jgi:hypothetical protein
MMFSTETKLRAEIEQVWMILRAERVTITAQAERIRVLREALDVARNGLAWYIDMHPDEADDSDAETMAQIDAALEATK